MGAEGSKCYEGKNKSYATAFVDDELLVDTTGAGDAFCGYMLQRLITKEFDLGGNIRYVLREANGAAALVTQRRGALCSMPTSDEIDDLVYMML